MWPISLEPGTTLAGYDIVAPIKAGGMATLFLARATIAQGGARYVALKVAHPALCKDQDFLRMFHSEGRVASRIDHPNVVRVRDVLSANGLHFLVMDYVHGCSLSQLRRELGKRGESVPIEVALWIGMKIAEGLHAAHTLRVEGGKRLNVVHRDVSPQNILLSYRGDVKLTDFGVAKAADSATTVTGQLKGKISYMAPEQAMGERMDRRVDIYALGLVLWELITRRRRFKADTDYEMLTQVMAAQPIPPSLYADVSKHLDTVLMTAMAAEPRRRFASALAFRDALARALPEATDCSGHDIAKLMNQTMRGHMEQGLREPETSTGFSRTTNRFTPDVEEEETLPSKRPAPSPSVPPSTLRPRASLVELITNEARHIHISILDHVPQLEARLGTLAVFGPMSTPELFGDPDAMLAYYLNAFVVFALLAIARQLETGGAAKQLEASYELDGTTQSLLDLDRELAQFNDSRLDAAVLGAIRSVGFEEPFLAEALDSQLDRAVAALGDARPQETGD